MKIQSANQRPSLLDNPIIQFLQKRGWKRILLTAAVLSLLCVTGLSGVYYGMHLYKVKKAESFDQFFENVVASNVRILPNLIKGYLYANPDRIVIDIKHKHLQKLAYKRSVALSQGILLTSSEDFVPAQIRYKDQTLKVKIRLKGDWTDHLLGDKWSFRIKVRGDNSLFGMKQFSIHHPKTRSHIYEWVYHEALAREDLLALRYEFVDVTLNGKDLGLYALEESFEKRLVENNRFREGPLVKFNENIMWEDRAAHNRKGDRSPTGLQSENVSNVDAFKTNTVLQNPALYNQFLVAQSLLETFRNGELPTSKVFNVEKLAVFFALSDLLGADHSAMWQNLRFYYNPVTSLLEPVGFDANAGGRLNHLVGAYRPPDNETFKFKDLAFKDQALLQAYVASLERFSSDSYLEQFFADIADELDENLTMLYRDFPHISFSRRAILDNRNTIRHALAPVKGLHAYYAGASTSRLELSLGNIQGLPIEVLDISYKDSLLFKPEHPRILAVNEPEKPLKYKRAKFRLPLDLAWSDNMKSALKLNYKILGTSQIRQEQVYAWPLKIDRFIESDFMRQPANIETFRFVRLDERRRQVAILPGDWTLDESMVIPAGYKVVCGQGTRLNLINGATILSYSSLDFSGSAGSPIIITSADSSGQGIAVLNAGSESRLEHVIFHNLSNPDQQGWSLTGAVSFYESPVSISQCQFIENRSEDALNTIRSSFSVQNSQFTNIKSDAFDADFCSGTVSGSSFTGCGNDAVDVSGSFVEVSDCVISGVGDKGLSAGENSRMVVRNCTITDSEIAIASKDKSDVLLDGIELVDCKVGFTLFQKKPEFDAANVAVQNLTQKNVSVPYLVEDGSELKIEGTVIAANRRKVKDILYGVEFGLSSK